MEPILHSPKSVTAECVPVSVVCGMVRYVCVSEREGEQCCNVLGLSPGPCSLPSFHALFVLRPKSRVVA